MLNIEYKISLYQYLPFITYYLNNFINCDLSTEPWHLYSLLDLILLCTFPTLIKKIIRFIGVISLYGLLSCKMKIIFFSSHNIFNVVTIILVNFLFAIIYVWFFLRFKYLQIIRKLYSKLLSFPLLLLVDQVPIYPILMEITCI